MSIETAVQTLQLGPKGPVVPALGVGTWSWGDSLFWSYGKDYGTEQVQAAFQASLDAGIQLFDTAEVYGLGKSEELLGRFLQTTDRPVAVATKYLPLPWRLGTAAVADALTASLKRLQLPTVALYQVHWPFDFFMGQQTLMQALAAEVKQGRALAVGVSNYSAQQMQQAHDYLAQWDIPLAVNQVQYSLLHRQIETNGVLELARQLGVTILAYSPLAQGLLTGKYSRDTYQPPKGARRLDPRFSRQGLVRIELVLKTLQEIGRRHQRSPAQVALNWLITQGNVLPIPGAKTGEQASQNAGALGWSMTPDEWQQLSQVSQSWLG
ncbi:Aldo-keto reductase [Halomicronema hongdechloris C2206]|uniref:Aldo-keto reductase n=1 Tax=Halomicronema hongdechloris C2206 TaxID=1641165 RepID=A0A1Z3HSU7_9CYAN|nr:aldo/keto reductase [Halomicronema hongdechloris]ASC73207.1 Aldo-keto reductase [Halomicronema hongdechloris C2206]